MMVLMSTSGDDGLPARGGLPVARASARRSERPVAQRPTASITAAAEDAENMSECLSIKGAEVADAGASSAIGWVQSKETRL